MTYFTTVWKFRNLQGFVWKTIQVWLGAKKLLLRYIAENLQVTKFKYALSAGANKMFQNRIVFVFTESWSHDQLLQKAYWTKNT